MRSRCSLLFALTISLAALLIPYQAVGGSLWGKFTDDDWKLGPPAKYPEANAVIMFDICSLTVTTEVIDVSRHVRIKVLSNAGLDDVANISIGYYDGDRIKDFKAQTVKPDGKVVKVDDKQVHTKVEGDYRSRVFSFPSVDSGCILEYSYRNTNERFSRLDAWHFQSDLYTVKSSLTLVLGPGFTYVTAFSNVPATDRTGVTGEILQAGGQPFKTFTWTRSELMPVKDEPYMAAIGDFRSTIRNQLVSYKDGYNNIKFISNWTDLGVKYQQWLDEYMQGGNLDKLLPEVLAGATTAAEKVAKAYQWVASNIAYKEDLAGSRYSHDNLSQLLVDKSGEGSEKNLLLCALLRKAGISSYPVLISTRDHARFNPEIYQLSQFNYLLTYAEFDSSVVFMDAITKYCPFGTLPSEKLVDGGFLVDGKKSQLVRVVRNEPKSYRYDLTDVRIDSEGVAHCSTSCSFSGYFAPTWGQLREESTPEQFMKDYFSGRIDSTATIDTNNFVIDSIGRCRLDATYTLKDFVRQLDNNLMIKPISYRFRKNPFTAAKRYYPIDFEFAQTYHNVMVVRSDRPLKDVILPRTVDLQIQGANYHRESSFENGVIRIDARLVLSNDAFPPSAYGDVKQLFDLMAGAQEDDIVLSLAQ